MENTRLPEQMNNLDDTEFALVFIDSICKTLKSVDNSDAKSNSLLFMYMSVVESIKKYRDLANETNHHIVHADVINLLINKGETYLTSVANDTTEDVYKSKAMYVSKELESLSNIATDLLVVLKSELLNNPKYEYLKQ